MISQELRKKFLDFFAANDHAIIGSASLIPENDPSVLFTTAGMHPLVPFIMGEKHPQGKRLADVQKCMRTGDIEEVGDKTHHTFFEMLGNWSLGDYWKKEAIDMSWRFLTEELQIPKEKLGVSIFGGNDDIPDYDKESEDFWLAKGMKPERIQKVKENWWGPAGQTGPCGPDTEIFYWSGEGPAPEKFDESDDDWVEIWNNVFMQYNKTADGKFEELKQKNIDTGMGLERTVAALNGFDDNYKTDLFWPLILELEAISNGHYIDNQKAYRVIADHVRSAVFVIGDQISTTPSNTGAGYVLRRLIRRAVRFGKEIGINEPFLENLARIVIEDYDEVYSELKTNAEFVISELKKEEEKFQQTLDKGLKQFDKLVSSKELNEEAAFKLFATYGFPLEMTLELAKEAGLKLSKEKYEEEFKKHQELSRTASAGMFKGGLADDSEMSKKYHTATHLLNQALRTVLGEHVEQRGSHINQERLRFDFLHPKKMSPEEIAKVEEIVNNQINRDLPVSWQEMSLSEAQKTGAIGVFTEKYGDKVKVYSMGDFSKEICGGPHVEHTGILGHFRIKKEESSSAGVRRIKAILE